MSDKTSAATGVRTITPSDAATIEPVPVSVYVGVEGDISVTMEDGSQAIFTTPSGNVLPIQPKRINATGTTAGNIIALYN